MTKKMWNGIAVDLGASSGRVIAGSFDGTRLSMDVLHRFDNEPVQLLGTLHWDILRLYHEVKRGIREGIAYLKQESQSLDSIGINSWGVDFGLFDSASQLMHNPVHYRDQRTDGMMERVFSDIARDRIYEITGIQFLPFNSIYQLIALREMHKSVLEQAHSFLMIPDMFNYFLTGEWVSEYTNATTTQLIDAHSGQWSEELLGALQIPRTIFQDIVQPGTDLGRMQASVQDEIGETIARVIAVATHDTASAVAAVPTQESHFAYLSLGTWALLGTELDKPIITTESLKGNFTNEGGVNGTFRFLKNLTGLWLLQETRRTWAEQGKVMNWDEITELTTHGQPFRSFIDPDDPLFLAPGNMPERVRDYCANTRQPVPERAEDLLRCITESMAFKIRYVFEQLKELSGTRFNTLYVVGGGSRNTLLCQWIANALGKEVITGPVESTAMGNLGVQLMAAGELHSLNQMRHVVSQSVTLDRYSPEDIATWYDAYNNYIKTTGM